MPRAHGATASTPTESRRKTSARGCRPTPWSGPTEG